VVASFASGRQEDNPTLSGYQLRPWIAGGRFTLWAGVAMRNAFFDAGMRKFIVCFARENFWRVRGVYDEIDDLVQDGYYIFFKCYARYRQITIKGFPSASDRRHFAALVEVAFTNHIHNLAKKRTLECAIFAFPDLYVRGDNPDFDRFTAPVPESCTMSALITQAPPELAALFKLLASDVIKITPMLRKRVNEGRVRLQRAGPQGWKQILKWETPNEYWCRLLGYDSARVNLEKQLQDFIFT